MEAFQNPILFRGIERMIIALGAIFFGYLGYKLFIFGIDRGHSRLSAESRFFKIIFSGTGPGLFFMAFGATILITSLFTGLAKTQSSVTQDANDLVSMKMQNPKLKEYSVSATYVESTILNSTKPVEPAEISEDVTEKEIKGSWNLSGGEKPDETTYPNDHNSSD